MSEPPSSDAVDVEYQADTGTYRAVFDGREVLPTVAVVEVMAALKGTEPFELDPLQDVVNAEALDRLCTDRDGERDYDDCRVAFPYLGSEVTVESSGVIEVDPESTDRETDTLAE